MEFGSTGQDDGEFNRPTDVAVDNEGTIYVTDYKNDRVQIFDGDGKIRYQAAGAGPRSPSGAASASIWIRLSCVGARRLSTSRTAKARSRDPLA